MTAFRGSHRLVHRARLGLALALVSLVGCGLSSKVDLVLDQVDSEAAKDCACNWQFYNYGSEDECIMDRSTSPSERECVQSVIAESSDDELNERVLDCYSRAYDDLGLCNGDLSCNDNLEWAACYVNFSIDIGQCADADSEVARDVGDCLT